MILLGHDAPPTYALAWSDCTSPVLASGGRDGSVVVWNLETHLSVQEGFKAHVGDENARANAATAGAFPSIDDSGFLSTKTRVCKLASTAAINGMARRQGKEVAGSATAVSTQPQVSKNGKMNGVQETDSWNEISGDDTDRKKKDSNKYNQMFESPDTRE
jgi:WD40 repeat protein